MPVLLTLRYDALFATPHRDRVTEELAGAAAAAAGLGVAALGIANTDLADGWAATIRAVARAFPGPLMVEAAPTSRDLTAILNDPRRAAFDTYFRQVWIPDECYYQTLARLHTRRLESRSLTLAKFDFQGKPHIFYDDHAELLARSGCFVARKIWPQAKALYHRFPSGSQADLEPHTGTIDRIFAQAVDRRTSGRRGLYMQSRFPFM